MMTWSVALTGFVIFGILPSNAEIPGNGLTVLINHEEIALEYFAETQKHAGMISRQHRSLERGSGETRISI